MKINKKPLDHKALKRSLWSSLSRVIGVGLSAGAGTMIHKMVGDKLEGWGLAGIMILVSFILMWVSEYERECE